MSKSDYEERKAARIEKFQRRAASNKSAANQLFERSRKLGDVIPLGQPILVGHHSEGRHRAHIKKIDNTMRQGVEASKKAEYYEDRARSAESNNSISSDDPNAIEKLKAKLATLEAHQEAFKAINKILKSKKMSDAEKVEKMMKDLNMKEETAQQLMIPYYGRVGIPSFRLTNNNANLKRIKDRITQLEKAAAIEYSEEIINGVTLIVNPEENRVQVSFNYKPDESIRKQLKSNGFHWSPQHGVWQRMITSWAIYTAKQILSTIKTPE